MSHALLEAAAFGDDPGRWPLPAAVTSEQRWWRAVAAGGQGHYGIASSDLAVLRRTEHAGRWASLAHSTQGSFHRQLGGHAVAQRWDGRALALAGSDTEAAVDALQGLAADALGLGRFEASAALLDRARAALEPSSPSARLTLRSEWVAAELAMARGDGAAAGRSAELAVELAAGQQSVRHQVKTQVISAAALCCAGRIDEARTAAEDVLSTAERLGLVPVQWAAASLLVDIARDRDQADKAIATRDACAEVVRRAGGVWRR